MRSLGCTDPTPGTAAAGRWLYCEFLLAHSLVQWLGTQPLVRLLRLVATAGTGARLSLQRSRTGFTVQVTDAIERTQAKRLNLEELRGRGGLLLTRLFS